MKSIFIAIPKTREDKNFIESFYNFINEIKDKYKVEVCEIKGLKRDEARNYLVDRFLESGFDYLLFLDDDHSGHKLEMLEDLMAADAYFATIKCFSRHYPYQCTLFLEDNKDLNLNFNSIGLKGTYPCKFAGFGMGLIKKELFSIIKKPYFVCNPIGEQEDNYFCKKLIANGIKPIGCFNYTLPHNGIDETNVIYHLNKNASTFIAAQNRKVLAIRMKKFLEESNQLTPQQEEVLNTIVNVL